VSRGEVLTGEESELFKQHPFVAYDLIAKIPRMRQVAEIIKLQDKYYDGYGVQGDTKHTNTIPMEARILKWRWISTRSNPQASRKLRRSMN
jgi:response regulator RpfG family c-di-GMP phosphodiesterase